jgi:GNAT superfamily N-acetyltransferase
VETRTTGSASGLGKRTGSNAGTAPQADSTKSTARSAADEYVARMPPAIEIRTDFSVQDDVVSRLHGLAFGDKQPMVSPWNQRLRQHSVTWAGAVLGEELVAFVHIVWDGGVHGFVLDTVVHPMHQRRGLGRAVVAAAVERAALAGCEWLHVDYEPPLDAFYRDACGFQGTEAGLMRLSR